MTTPDPASRPGPDGPDHQPLSVAGVVGGVVGGVLLQLALGTIVTVALVNSGWENLAVWAIFVVAALALVVLLVPRWRRAGAGMILGLAIGSIIFAGICGAVFGIPTTPGQG